MTDFGFGHDDRMSFNDYQNLALRTLNETDTEKLLTLGGLGIAGEAGEVTDLVKKFLFHGHGMSDEKLRCPCATVVAERKK
jgi:hypothetical protein